MSMTAQQKFNRRLFGLRVEAKRKERRMKQQTLADAVGVSRPQVANIEGGRSSTSVDRLIKLARALRVRPATLLKGLD